MRKTCLLVCLMLVVAPGPALAQNIAQTFQLRAGWNSIWLEVEPPDTSPATVFSGVPINAVWTFQRRLTSVDFIQDPAEPIWNRDAWLSYVPTNRLESLANNLFAIFGGRAYLVNCSAAASLSVTGRPVFRNQTWAQNAYNLRGLPIDPGAPPTFRDFFRYSSAHYNSLSGQMHAVYHLNASGNWELIGPTERVAHGIAYWILCQGASDYVGPLTVQPEAGDELDYGRSLTALSLRLINRRPSAANVIISELETPASGSVLAYRSLHLDRGVDWLDLPTPHVVPLAAGAFDGVRLGVQRQQMSGDLYQSLLQVGDNAGTRFLIPITVRRFQPGPELAPLLLQSGGTTQSASPLSPAEEARSHAGLWVGAVNVSAVSEVHSGMLTTNTVGSGGTALSVSRTGVSSATTPTRGEFNLRLILHVDTNGVTRLLREVIQLWQEGTVGPTPQGFVQTVTPGRHVLVTDERRISQYQGATVRDGVPVGRRLSTVGFDFPVASAEQNFLLLSGYFAGGQTVAGTINLPATHPTNPFRHKFHPDHDNLAADFRTFREEAYPVIRSFNFEFAAMDPAGTNAAPDYGYSQIAGTFRETVTGLHRESIHAQGTFRLQRVAEIGELNP